MEHLTVREVSRASSGEISRHLDRAGYIVKIKQGVRRFRAVATQPQEGVPIVEFKHSVCKLLKGVDNVGEFIVVTKYQPWKRKPLRSWKVSLEALG